MNIIFVAGGATMKKLIVALLVLLVSVLMLITMNDVLSFIRENGENKPTQTQEEVYKNPSEDPASRGNAAILGGKNLE